MSDIFNLGNPTGTNPIQDNALGSTGSRLGTDLKTGALRRKFNFGDRVSELALSQDPFFRFVSKVAKNPTDDPAFKFTEKRGSWMKRYAYVVSHGADASVATTDPTVSAGALDAGDDYYVKMGTDYKSQGNMQNVFGQASGDISVGDSGTKPEFFLQGQVIKLNYRTAGEADAADLYNPDGNILAKVKSVTASGEYQILKVTVVKGTSSSVDFIGSSDSVLWTTGVSLYDKDISGKLEAARCYVVGSAYAEGSGYPETWKDQPYGTGYGQTQIWKTSAAMTNTMRATSLKYEQNEWSRIWRDKLIEHKYDIEQSILFGSQYIDSDGVQYTQGVCDFALNYGNKFSWSTAKTQDDFLDDMSSFLDPRYNGSGSTVFFVDTEVYNWLHKLGGYMKANLDIDDQYRADMMISGKKKVLGLDITTISTPYGDMNVARNIHLDGTNISILGVNMNYVKYRPLVGNGINRDTSVYVGVQTLENSGIDRRVDLILTEAGMQFEMPECHAVWTKAESN